MPKVTCHQQTACDCKDEPQDCNCDENKESGQGSNLCFSLHLGRFSAIAALLKHFWRHDLLNQLEPYYQNDQIIHESDYGDKTRNNLNRAKQIAGRAGGNQSCVPGRLGMFERKVENVSLLLEFSRLFSPNRNTCGQSSHPANPSHGRNRIRKNRIVEFAFQCYPHSY